MAFVKLDCGMLNSTIWFDRVAREVFITALLMAEPIELTESTNQIEVNSLKETDFVIPPGWYGFVPAAGPGITHRAGVEQTPGLAALERLGAPEPESRTPDFGGRRLVRVDGGYLVLNYDKYRRKDHTTAERSRRYRESQKEKASRVTSVTSRVTTRGITQAEAEAEAEGRKNKQSPPAPPLPFASATFSEAWTAFTRHRSEIRKPLRPTSTKASLKALAALGETRAVVALNHTVAMGWQGIREPELPNGQHRPTPRIEKPHDPEPANWRERLEAEFPGNRINAENLGWASVDKGTRAKMG